MRSSRVAIIVLSMCLLWLSSSTTFADPLQQGPNPPIRLRGATFTPRNGETPNVPAGLQVANYAQNQRGYFIVQFQGPVDASWKADVAATGAEILDYIPDFAFKVRMTPAQARDVEQLDNVGWVGLYHPAYKLSSTLKRTDVSIYLVKIERGADATNARTEIARSGVQVLGQQGSILTIAANSAQLDAVARVLDVAWVENYILREKHNEYGAGGIIRANIANANGYDGSTQTVAVADTGLGNGTAAGAHTDIPASRVVSVYNWPGVSDSCWTITDDGAIDVDSGHGTHTAGSVLSDGGASGEGKGSAPAAKLVFQATENWATMKGLCAIYYTSGYYLTGLPSDLNLLFQQTYNDGARIHSNSWGSAAAGDYTVDSANADMFVWNHRDMVITFSAGNEGIDANADGVVDNDSMGAPATAKNVISVGASENDRGGSYPCDANLTYTSHDAYQPGQTCGSMSGNQVNNLGTYGQRWGADFPANPIANDVTAGNANQMAAFSSRGPTDDGRIKPDVVAPGTWILSGFSSLYQEGYGDPLNPKNSTYQWDGWGMPINGAYKYMGGTSMSNPIAAGGAAVVRDYYQKAHALSASAALVKATLINSAVDLLDENNDGANDNDFPIPNVHEGWGRIDLANATDNSHKFVDHTAGVSTNNTKKYQATVAGGALKVTVVWSDYPSTDAATINLVNDLDVVVKSPSGTVYQGNVFSGGWSATGGSVDRRNNVENVYIQSAAAGTWTIEVKGFNVPNGPQPFALVVDGTSALSEVVSLSTGLKSPTTAAADTGGDGNGFQTNAANAFANDSVFAVDTDSGSGTATTCTSTQKDRQRFYNYTLGVPSGATINGIEVRLDAKVDNTSGAPKMCVELSWDGGVTWTTAKTTATLTKSEVTYTLGNSSDTWGRTWTDTQLNNTNFRLRIINIASNTSRDFSLDWVAVNVHYQ